MKCDRENATLHKASAGNTAEAATHLVMDDCRELDVEVTREPILWLQLLQQLLGRPGAKGAVLNLGSEVLLEPHEPFLGAVVVDAARPVMRHENVVVPRQLFERKTHVLLCMRMRDHSCCLSS